MKSPREVLMSLFGHGWAVDECLDPTPEETYIDEALSDLSEIVMGLRRENTDKLYDRIWNDILTDIASLFRDKGETK